MVNLVIVEKCFVCTGHVHYGGYNHALIANYTGGMRSVAYSYKRIACPRSTRVGGRLSGGREERGGCRGT